MPALVVTGLALFGLGVGMCDVSMNVEGAANERQLGRTVMPLFHALFSGGTILGAALGAVAELAGISIAIHLGIIGLLMILTVLVAVRYLQPDPGCGGRRTLRMQRNSRRGRRGHDRLALPARPSGAIGAPC